MLTTTTTIFVCAGLIAIGFTPVLLSFFCGLSRGVGDICKYWVFVYELILNGLFAALLPRALVELIQTKEWYMWGALLCPFLRGLVDGLEASMREFSALYCTLLVSGYTCACNSMGLMVKKIHIILLMNTSGAMGLQFLRECELSLGCQRLPS